MLDALVPPVACVAGDEFSVHVSVTDPDRESRAKPPLESGFVLKVDAERAKSSAPSGSKVPKQPVEHGKHSAPRLALPQVTTIRQDRWDEFNPAFSADEAFRVIPSGNEDSRYDFFVNLDSKYLISYLKTTKESRELVIHWFKWGLTLCALGILRGAVSADLAKNGGGSASSTETDEDVDDDGGRAILDDIKVVNRSANGIASVIIPIIRNLYKGAGAPG